MAVLHSYAQSADQSGYYLKGWTPETGHTTIQVRPICEDLFDWLEFSVGDQIPHDLLHGLLDVGLLYTGDPTKAAENIPDDFDFSTDVKNVLTEKQYNRLIGFVRSYGDEVPAKVEQLVKRLDAQTTVVDDKYIPDAPGAGSISTNDPSSRNIDHGRFEDIIQDVYEEGEGTELPDPLAEIELPAGTDREYALHTAAEYHDEHYPVTAVRVTDMQLEYATRLPAPVETDITAGPLCGFRVGLEDDSMVVLETIVDPDTPEAVLDYNEPGIRHRLVIASDHSVDWETVLPQDSELTETDNRDELLEHQTTVLRMMDTAVKQHPGISGEMLIEMVVEGGYLERGTKTTHNIWRESSLLGELLAPDNPGDKLTGTVDFFHDRKGYGFINTSDREEDVFYHMEDVGGPDIEEGQRVRFNVMEAEEGPRATNVERLD